MPRNSDSKGKGKAIIPAEDLSRRHLLRAHFVQESPEQTAEWLKRLDRYDLVNDPFAFAVPRHIRQAYQEREEEEERAEEATILLRELAKARYQAAWATHVARQAVAASHASGSNKAGSSSGAKVSGNQGLPTNAELDKMVICNPDLYTRTDKQIVEAYNRTKVDPIQHRVDKFPGEDTAEEWEKGIREQAKRDAFREILNERRAEFEPFQYLTEDPTAEKDAGGEMLNKKGAEFDPFQYLTEDSTATNSRQ